MRAFAIGLLLISSAACDAGTTHHINETHGFCLTVPADFEERRITITGQSPVSEIDTYDLIGTFNEIPVTLSVGVNRYDTEFPEDKILVEYIWKLRDGGVLEFVSRNVTIPNGAINYSPIATSLFYGPDGKTLHYFRMDLKEDGFEELFVDIVGSFQSFR